MTRSNQGVVDRSKDGAGAPPAWPHHDGSDFLQLSIDNAPTGGRADWLTRELRQAIAGDRLSIGSALPATRVLAADLRISRGVVTEAYQRLTDEGLLAGQGRRGTIVISSGRPAAPVPGKVEVAPRPADRAPAGTIDARPATSSPFAGIDDNSIFDALRAAPARIDLTPGAPDLAAFPRAGWLRAERNVLTELSDEAFGYPNPQGALTFRRSVAGWLARNRGMTVDPDEVIVVAGVAQALALLARVLRADGIDRIAVEDPGSRGAREQLQSWGMSTPPIQVDFAGLQVDELTANGAPAVLVTPAHQFPTGVVLDGGRRRELLAWAADGGLIIEDDYDAEHRYDRPPTPALHSMLTEQICYSGSVSKLLAPALRVGWLVVPDRLRGAIVAAKRETDLGNPVLAQLVLARMFDSGDMERHLRLVRRRHRRRRDAMVTAIREHLPTALIHGAAAGLHLTITFPGDRQFSDLEVAAAALDAGVKIHPLSWHRQLPGPTGLVLGYAASSPTEIAEGVSTVASVLPRSR